MGYYVGYRDKQILLVSKTPFEGELSSLKLPDEFAKTPSEKIIREYEVRRGRVVRKDATLEPATMRIAFVGVYKIPCGISTYSEWLFPEIYSRVQEYKIFAESAELATEPHVVRCWTRGQSLEKLVEQIHAFDPDVVLVEHEYGIFPNGRHWMAFITQMQRYRTFVTLHSVYRNHGDKVIIEASVPNIIVHTSSAARVLKEKGISGNVTIIPHGSLPCQRDEKYWNRYLSPHTFIQFGFGFPYKGWENSIKAVSILKERYPEIFFTGLFSESPYSKALHEHYYTELLALAKELGVSNQIGILRGFFSDQVIDSFFRTNQVAVFPYIDNGVHTVYAASGAVRVAMRSGIPVIASRVPLFDDIEGVCPRVTSAEELAAEIENFWSNSKAVEDQKKAQARFLNQTHWKNVAIRHLDLFSAPPKKP